jgi:hypothetical protein
LASTTALVDGDTYYATQTVAGCESPTTAVTVTIGSPVVDSPSDVIACGSYTLPALTSGTYYTQAGGVGATLNAGDVINTVGTTTLYLYAANGACFDENTFDVVINPASSNTTTIVACDTYTWAVNNQNYTTSGIYTVVNGCDTEILNLTINTSPTFGGAVVTDVSCNGLSDGSVVITSNGGLAPYVPSPSTTNLAAGTYNFIVTDANGCSYTTTATIAEPTVLVASGTNSVITVSGGSSTVTIGATGGTPAYVGTGTFTVTAGTYTYTVTDANSCTSDVTLTIVEPLPLTVTATGSNAACFGGIVTVNVVPTGGTAPYTGGGTFNVVAGTYT